MHFVAKRQSVALNVILVISLLVVFLQPAKASQQLVERFQELAQSSGFTFNYVRLEALADDAFSLHDITLIRHGVEDPIKIKTVTFRGVKELAGTGLSAEHLALTGLSWDGRGQSGNEIQILLRSAEINGIYIPGPEQKDASVFGFDRHYAKFTNFAIFVNGVRAIELPTAVSEITSAAGRTKYSGHLESSNIIIDPQYLANENKLPEFLKLLGYDKLNMDISANVDWDVTTGRIVLRKFEFDLTDIGVFDLRFAINGYTHELARRFQILKSPSRSELDNQSVPASPDIIETLSEITLESASLLFRDGSFTEKLIALQAQSQGQSSKDMKAILPIFLSGVLAGLQKPTLANQLVEAVTLFLAKPGTIQLSLAPKTLLSIADIIGLAGALPAILIDKLNISAVAN